MKRFLTKSCSHGTFMSRPKSFGACIVSSDRGHGNVKVKNIWNFNTFWTSDQTNIRNLNTFRAPDRCAIEKPKEFQYVLIIRSKNIRNLNTLCVVLNIEFQYKTEQIGIRCSGTQKCSQRFEIDHFCPGNISAIQSLKFFVNPIRESFVSQLNVRLQISKFMVPA